MIINQVVTGGSGGDTSDATALPGDVRLGKTFYGSTGKAQGTLIVYNIPGWQTLLDPVPKKNMSILYDTVHPSSASITDRYPIARLLPDRVSATIVVRTMTQV